MDLFGGLPLEKPKTQNRQQKKAERKDKRQKKETLKNLSKTASLLWEIAESVSNGNAELHLSKRAVSSLYFKVKDKQAVYALWEIEKKTAVRELLKTKKAVHKVGQRVIRTIESFPYVVLKVSEEDCIKLIKAGEEVEKLTGVCLFPKDEDEDLSKNKFSRGE
jgi:hypothetical protein